MYRCTAWIAGFAILLAALAPVISNTLLVAKATPDILAEICSVTGSRMVVLDRGQDAPAKKSTPMASCPYCLNHVAPLAWLPDIDLAPFIAGNNYLLPTLFYHSPRQLFAWAVAQARAPPTFS